MGAAVASREKASAVWEPGMCPPGSKCCAGKKRFGKSDSLASPSAEPPAAPRAVPAWKSSASVFNPRLWTAAPRIPPGVLNPGRGGSAFVSGAFSLPGCQRMSKHAPRGAASARYKARSGSDSLSSWHGCVPVWITAAGIPGNCSRLREQRLSSETGADSSPERQQEEPGWCRSSRPAPEKLGRSLPAIREQLFHEAAARSRPRSAHLLLLPPEPGSERSPGTGLCRDPSPAASR